MSSRRDLVGKVFFAHYEPRVRDNERRVIDGASVRGGPFQAGWTARTRALHGLGPRGKRAEVDIGGAEADSRLTGRVDVPRGWGGGC